MRQCWLRPNRRALSLGFFFPSLFLLTGLFIVNGTTRSPDYWVISCLGWLMILAGLWLLIFVIYFMFLPRLAFENGELLVYMQSSKPIRVPIDIVECFFLGQAPSLLAGSNHNESETATIVVRLAESATDWKNVDVKSALGRWSDGYIVVNGTWSEPINSKLIQLLNAKLIEAQQKNKTKKDRETSSCDY